MPNKTKFFIFIFILTFLITSLLVVFIFSVENKRNSKVEFICENNILKYKEREYIRNIFINSSIQIKCNLENNQIIIIND